MLVTSDQSFDGWVTQCRQMVLDGVAPEQAHWSTQASNEPEDLFGALPTNASASVEAAKFSVPKAFKDLAFDVFHHRSPERFHLLYSALWRIVHGERELLEKLTDPVVHPLLKMRKQVTRDAHKMKAFVRFRRVEQEGVEWFVAWHCPDHLIVRYVAPFFQERFAPMNWSILTPDESVHWNQQELTYTGGVPQDPIQQDQVEDLWRTYYASVFNPSRLKIKAMKTEMPIRHWRTMPETSIIPELVASSRGRTAAMLEVRDQTAVEFIPPSPTIETLREAANSCRGCPLFHGTTQAVCSHGPADSPLVLVGEQPGNEEDLKGEPFVGPAGQVLNKALAEAGLERMMLYITEAVKHFKHDSKHGRRYHRTPAASDVAACRPWLAAEMSLVKPKVLLCLGTTAAHSVIGKQVTLKSARGQVISTPMCSQTIVTTHPAAVLRHPDPAAQQAAYAMLVEDLRLAGSLAF